MKWMICSILLMTGIAKANSHSGVAGPPDIEALFPVVAETYYAAHIECHKPVRRNRPSERTRALSIHAYISSATRWWPEDPVGAAIHMMALAHTEGGGSARGAKADPNVPRYGPMHVGETEAIFAGRVWGNMPYRNRTDKWFQATLRGNPHIAITYAAGYLRICYDRVGHDWNRAVAMYKFGEGEYYRAFRGAHDFDQKPPIVVRRYIAAVNWIGCIRDKVKGAAEAVRGCPCEYKVP